MTAQRADAAKPLSRNDVAEVLPVYRSLKDRVALADAVVRGRVVGNGRV